jgi:hypothetical protein
MAEFVMNPYFAFFVGAIEPLLTLILCLIIIRRQDVSTAQFLQLHLQMNGKLLELIQAREHIAHAAGVKEGQNIEFKNAETSTPLTDILRRRLGIQRIGGN